VVNFFKKNIHVECESPEYVELIEDYTQKVLFEVDFN
jgi:hypothetical protein